MPPYKKYIKRKPGKMTGRPPRETALVKEYSAHIPAGPRSSLTLNRPIYAPDAIRRHLRYSENRVITSGAGSMAVYSFLCNGLYDPNVTGTGHQPLAFDQYMALYSLYCVLSCRVTLEVYNQVAIPIIVGAAFAAATTGPTNATGYIEAGQCVYRALPADLTVPIRVTATINLAQFFNKRNINDDQQFCGTSAANAAVPAYCNVFVQDTNQTSVATAQVLVTLDFDALFFEPRSIDTS